MCDAEMEKAGHFKGHNVHRLLVNRHYLWQHWYYSHTLFPQIKRKGADKNSFIVLLDGFLAGRVLNWFIVVGAICFILWRFYEAFKDPYNVGNDAKGNLLRTGAAFSSGADAFIALSAFQALFNQQEGTNIDVTVQQRNIVAGLLEQGWGQSLSYSCLRYCDNDGDCATLLRLIQSLYRNHPLC